jgi:hypothetical protein
MTRIDRNMQGQIFVEFCCISYYIVHAAGFIVIHNALATVIKRKAELNCSHIFMFEFYKPLPEKYWQFFAPLLLCHFRILNLQNWTADGGTVVKVLCYKSEGRWFDSRWCHWNFSLT